MDPDATLRDLLEAAHSGDWNRVDELADALRQWLETDGFPPLTIGPAGLGRAWHRSVATGLCHLAVSLSRDARKRRP